MRKIFTSTFYGLTDIEHKVYIWDRELAAGGTPTTMILESPGYTIDWNSNIADVVKGGIIESSASIYIRNKNNILDSFLNTLSTSNENRFLVEIYRESSPSIPIWRGIILQDFGAVEDSPYGAVQLTAKDGLSLLDFIDVPDITLYEKKTILKYIIEGLCEIPTEELIAASGNFVRVKTDWFTAAMPAGKEPLDLCVVLNSEGGSLWNTKKIREGYNGTEVKETEFMSYKEMINQILIHFNAVLLMSRGVWYILQRDELTEADIQFYGFKKDGTDDGLLTTEPTYKSILPASSTYRADGQFNSLPGLKKVKVTYLSNFENSDGFSSLIPSSFTLMDTYTTAPLLTGTGNKLRIGIGFKETFQLATYMTTFKAYMQYALDVRMGSYYLEAYGAQYRWTLTPSVVLINSSIVTTPTNGGMTVQATTIFDEITEDIPVDDEVIITLTRSGWVSVYAIDPNMPLSYVLPSFSTPADIINLTAQTFVLFIFNNETPVAYVVFEAENTTTEYSLEHILEDNLFGSAGVGTSNGLFIIWNGSAWVYSLTPPTKLWGKGFASSKTQYFNELLVNELLSNQAKALLMFSGTIHDRTTSELLLPSQAIEFTYKGNTYRFYQNKVTYNPEEESWYGDWIEISRTPITNAVIDGTDITVKPPPLSNELIEWGHIAGQVIDINSVIIQKQDVTPIPFPVAGSTAIGIRPTGQMELRDGDNPGNETVIAGVTTTKEYGLLYNFPAVEGDSLKSIVNPNVDGGAWRIPSETDWNALKTYLDDSLLGAGGKLKETGTTHWKTPNTGATNEVGFIARPSGARDYNGLFGGDPMSTIDSKITENVLYWTSTEFDVDNAKAASIRYDSDTLVVFDNCNRKNGCSIRVMRDAVGDELNMVDGTKVNEYVGNDGKIYKAVKIGTQIWIVYDLNETLYDDLTEIPILTLDVDWAADTLGACCYYDNDITNGFTRGGDIPLPKGGTTGQVPVKQSDAEGDVKWEDIGAGVSDIKDLTNGSTTITSIPDGYFFQLWESAKNWKKITYAKLKDLFNALFVKLDQTTPQTFTGGIPLSDQDVSAFNQDKQYVIKEYVDNLARGGNKLFYFTKDASDVAGMYKALTYFPNGALQTFVHSAVDGESVIAEFITDVATEDYIVTDGARFFHFYAKTSDVSKPCQLKGYVYTTDLAGANPVLLRKSSLSTALDTMDAEYVTSVYGNTLLIDHTTTRVKFVVAVVKTGTGVDPIVTLSVNNNTFSRLEVPSPVGVTDISGLVPYTGATTDVNLAAHGLISTGNSQVNPLYTKWVSLTADTIGDRRINDGINEECTSGAVTKGGGTWVAVPSGGVSQDDFDYLYFQHFKNL